MQRLGASAALQRSAAASANSTADEDSTSDFVALYYKLYWQAQALPSASAASADSTDVINLVRGIPGDIAEELRGYSLTFEELPSLLQRAVLWDAGYVLSASGDGELATILTDCERASTMADVALSAGEMADAACSSVVCSTATSSSSGSWTAVRECESLEGLESLIKCASTSVGAAASADVTSIWSTGNGSLMKRNATPSLFVWRHDAVSGSASSILAIHSASASELSQTGTGASPDQVCAAASTLVIPCVPYAASSSARWCRPGRSPLLMRWLREYAELLGLDTSGMVEVDSSGSDADGSSDAASKENESGVVINPDFQFDGRSSDLAQQFYRRHVAGDQVDALALPTVPKGVEEELNTAALQFSELPSLLQRALLWDSGYVQDDNGGLVQIYTECGLAMSDLMLSTSEIQDASPESDFLGAFSDPFPAMVPNATAGLGSDSASGWIDLINSMKLLLESRNVCDSVIAFQDLQFHHLVGRGSCGEVWLCLLFDQRVAAKRLLKRRRKCTSGALEMFTNEILLTASLCHPHIVRFVGVASSTLHNLWLVTEYMENGDLHHCLQSFGAQLSWRREKLQIAIGIVRGLCFLHHDLSPAVVHCDLKPRNVLLTSTLEAKLTDFGTSRHCSSDADDGDGDRAASERSDASRGSDAPLWSAPEVLQSREFSRKADMYSLGLVLCELDTLRHPFADAKDAKDVPPLRMLQRIADGRVQPQLSHECPPPVAELVASCLARDPSRRPSALDALEVLDAMPAVRADTFSF